MNNISSAKQIKKSEEPQDKIKIIVDLLREIDKSEISDFGDDPLEADMLINLYAHFSLLDSSSN